MKNSRAIEDLVPEMQEKVKAFIALCKLNEIDIIITSTLRDYESQQALYNQGRTTPGKVVTNAKPGFSFHNFGVAADFCPIVNGKAMWSDTKLFTKCGVLAEQCGLDWSGRWKSFPELAHVQLPGLSLEELRKNHAKQN